MDRLKMLLDLIGEYPPQDPDSCPIPSTASDCPRYLLVESSRLDGGYWLSLADTPEDAAKNHDGQEHPEDFDVEGLYDLDTGDCFEITATTTSFAVPADESQLTVTLAPGGATYETYADLFAPLLGLHAQQAGHPEPNGWNIALNGIDGQVLDVNDEGIRIQPMLDDDWLTFGEPMDLVPWDKVSSISIH